MHAFYIFGAAVGSSERRLIKRPAVIDAISFSAARTTIIKLHYELSLEIINNFGRARADLWGTVWCGWEMREDEKRFSSLINLRYYYYYY